MIDKELALVISLLSKERDEIRSIINPTNEQLRYFDRDSEDEGTTSSEVALLRLCLIVFLVSDDLEEIENEIQEITWVFNLVLSNYDSGVCLFNFHSEYDYLWEIARRYSKIIMQEHEKYRISDLSDFKFLDLLNKHDFSVEKEEN